MKFLLPLMLLFPLSTQAATATAIFAGGCFWCSEHDFESVPGVVDVVSGYTGGHVKDPTYEQVSAGGTGHFEAIRVTYKPEVVSYQRLLEVFWRSIDPTDAGGQFCDRGNQYRSAIFYGDDKEKKLAEESKATLVKSGKFKDVATLILPAETFYPAEEYHQNYATKNPLRYQFYRYSCARDEKLKKLWE